MGIFYRGKEMIRYYKGIVKLERISEMSPMKTALYNVLEDGLHLKKDTQILAPVRLCWRKKKCLMPEK